MATKKIGCPFQYEATYSLELSSWMLEVIDARHTHEASSTPSTHTIHRRLNATTKERALLLANKTVPAREIVASLVDDGVTTTTKAIYNLLSTARKERLGGRTAIQALLDK